MSWDPSNNVYLSRYSISYYIQARLGRNKHLTRDASSIRFDHASHPTEPVPQCCRDLSTAKLVNGFTVESDHV